MATLIVELDSVASDILKEFPGSEVKYEIPKQPQPNLFVIRAPKTDLSAESRTTFRIERDYQIIYFTNDPQTALDTMDRYSRRCLKGLELIPLTDNSLRYIRINSFGYGLPMKTEAELYTIIGMMPTELRQARDQEAYQKMMQVKARLG